jgi:hypothetical protein
MSLNNKPLESLTEADLQLLLNNSVPESRTLDYKRDPIGSTTDEKKEFLYDVSSFANASGGYLILGIDEEGGVPTQLCGLEITDPDAEILRLDSMIRDGIAPRIPGVKIRAIPFQNGRVAIVLEIRRSWASPHMVTFKGASKFYSRSSVNKQPLDVAEIKAAFLRSETTAERIRNFRRDRLAAIVARETPVVLHSESSLVLHVVPIGAFDTSSQIDVNSMYDNCPLLLSGGGHNQRLNFDGVVAFDGSLNEAYSYVQVFRNGVIEVVDTWQLGVFEDKKIIDPRYELTTVKALHRFLNFQKDHDVEPPLLVMLSFIGVKGYAMGVGSVHPRLTSLIDREALLVSEVLIEDFNVDIPAAMKPIFDTVWNATGFSQSRNYDKDGNWAPKD